MPAISKVRHFFLSLFARQRLDSSLDEEMQLYIEEIAQRKVHAGVPEAEARRQARLEFEGIDRVKEEVRDVWLGASLVAAGRDLRIGIRTLRRAPAFSVAAILTLGFSIGMNVAVFSVVRSLLWRPLPYPDADRIVMVEVDAGTVGNAGAAPGEILALRARSRTLDHIGMFSGVDANVDAGGEMEHVAAASASDDILPLLGAAPPALGRTLNSRDDDAAGGVRSILISDALWRRRFGADAGVIGRVVQINNLPMSIAGVLRPGFRVFLPPAANAAEETDVWFPSGIGRDFDYRGFSVFARLKPRVTVAQAQAELDSLAAGLMREHPEAYARASVHLSAIPLQETLTRDVRPTLRALTIAVAFVLLIGCVNVANLVLARAKAREQELAIRGALGASRPQLTRLLFAESLLLGGASCVIGLLLGHAGLLGLRWLKPDHVPLQSQVVMDGSVAAFAVGLSIACTFLFGLLPALRQTAQSNPQLKATRGGGLTHGARSLQRGLVIAEVALSIVPLMSAGLMLRTFVNLVHAPIGFDPGHILAAKMPMSFRAYPDAASRWRVLHQVLDGLQHLPGAAGASAASPLPFQPMQITRRYSRPEQAEGAMPLATQQSVAPGYLRLVGIGLRAGRDFTAEDIESQRPVVIVDERLARRLWPDGALGRRLAIWTGRRKTELEVVGITNSVRVTQVRDDDTPHFFVPYHVYPVEMSLVIRTEQPAAAMTAAVKRIVVAAGTRRAAFDVRPMKDDLIKSIGDSRFLMLILTGFAAASLLLAAMGLYGTLAYLVAQRRHELGVRIALGASQRQILSMVIREGMRLTAFGVVIGTAGTWAVTRLLRGFLYQVQPFDGLTLASVAVVVAVAATVSAAAPAWRASRMDPNLALRT